MAWLSGWNFRKTVTITGQSGAGTNYQICFSIGAATGGDFHLEGHCTSFPNDIQFTDNDGATLLDYWVEDLAVDPIKVWVKVADDLGDNVDIYIYYGKSGESSASDGTNTFEFFDNFEGTSLDTIPTSGDVAVADDSGKYEAWPGIAKDSSGYLFVVCRTSDTNTHDFDSTGRVVIRKSTDNGQTWSSEVVVANEAGIDERNTDILIFDDNGTETILVVYNTHDGTASNDRAYCRKSTDGGSNWGAKINLSSGNPRRTWNPPIELSNGKILVPLYSVIALNTYVVESSDGGDTWTEYTVTTSYGDEFSIIETKTGGSYTGGIYGLIRDPSSPHVYKKVTSTDYGHTWSAVTEETDFDDPYMSPITFHRAPSGELLAVYTKDTGDLLEIYESTDEGVSWSRKATLVSGASISYYPTLETINSSKLIVCWCVNGDTSDVYVNFVDYPIVPPKWVIYSGSTPTLSNSIMTLDSPTQKIHSNDYWNGYSSSIALEMKIKHNNARMAGFSKKNGGDKDYDNYIALDDVYNYSAVEYNNDGWNGGIGLTENTWLRFKVLWNSSDVYSYEDSMELGHKTPSDGNGIPNYDAWIYYYIYSGDSSPLIEVDWTFVRKYASPEPAFSGAGEEGLLYILLKLLQKKGLNIDVSQQKKGLNIDVSQQKKGLNIELSQEKGSG